MSAAARMMMGVFGAAWALAGPARPAAAEPSRLVDLEGLATWLEGDLGGAAITEDGSLVLPPARAELWEDAATAFTAAAPFGDGLVLARAGGGELLVLRPDGKLRPLATLEAAGVSALVAAPGGVWAATLGGEAKLMWVSAHGAVREVAAPPARYVWAACADGDDAVLLACGEPGVVVRVSRGGASEVLYRSEQLHLRSIVRHRSRGVFVGGGERGVVVALAAGGARALFDSGHAEVTALAVDDEALYVAGVSGAAALLRAGDEEGGGKPPEVRSQIARIDLRGRVEVLAGSADEAALALALDAQGTLMVATGSVQQPAPRGRLYGIEPRRRALRLLMESPSRRLTHLLLGAGGRLWVVGAAGGRIASLAPRLAAHGTFVSAPIDAGLPATLGSVEALGEAPAATGWRLSARGGHTQQPDGTWSPWSPPALASPAQPLRLPTARFFQVRLQLTGNGSATPEVRQIRLALRRHNLPPVVRQVMALRPGVALLPLPREDNKGKVVVVGEPSGDDGRDELRRGGGLMRARQVPERGALALRWAAEDPNGDELRFDLSVRPLAGGAWLPLREGIAEPYCTLAASQFPDGRYVFRVRACDSPDNPDDERACDQRDSQVVTIDHTPPTLSPLQVRVAGDGARVRGEVADNLGPLTELTYAVDHGAPRPLLPEDGVLDGPRETFELRLSGLAAGPHVVVVRAVDGADNEALVAATIAIAAGGGR